MGGSFITNTLKFSKWAGKCNNGAEVYSERKMNSVITQNDLMSDNSSTNYQYFDNRDVNGSGIIEYQSTLNSSTPNDDAWID